MVERSVSNRGKLEFVLVQTQRESGCAVIVLNRQLMTLDHHQFPWQLTVTFDLHRMAQSQRTGAEKVDRLERLGEALSEGLTHDGNALFAGRVTWNGSRQLIFRLKDPDPAEKFLGMTRQASRWEDSFGYLLEPDPEWSAAQEFLQILDRSQPTEPEKKDSWTPPFSTSQAERRIREL